MEDQITKTVIYLVALVFLTPRPLGPAPVALPTPCSLGMEEG